MRGEALMADLPSRIDRATFDRVLQRAAELQAASKDIGDGLSEEEILALGTEVGIPAQHLQQALLEERTKVTMPEANGMLDRLIGPADFVAQRVVQGSAEAVGTALTKWMERNEHMVVQRGNAGRITFEQMPGFARGLRRIGAAFDGSRGRPYLDKAELVTAVITPLEAGFCHVTLGASLRRVRSGYIGGGTGLAITGAVMGGIISIAGAPIVVGALIVAGMGAGGIGVSRIFHRLAQRAQLGLERALDDLERRPPLPGERTALPSAQPKVGNVIREIAKEVRKALEE